MKRLVVGIVIGMMLSLSATVYAEEIKSMVGRAIEGTFPVHVNGKTLETRAIVIDGTSYLPVREISEKLNMVVKFDSEKGITLEHDTSNTPEWAGTVIIGPPAPTPPPAPKKTLEEIEAAIESQKQSAGLKEWWLNVTKENGSQEAIKRAEHDLQEVKDRIAELEKQKAELTK